MDFALGMSAYGENSLFLSQLNAGIGQHKELRKSKKNLAKCSEKPSMFSRSGLALCTVYIAELKRHVVIRL